jgi:hypothetical protein
VYYLEWRKLRFLIVPSVSSNYSWFYIFLSVKKAIGMGLEALVLICTGFAYRLGRLNPRALRSREPLVKVYSVYNFWYYHRPFLHMMSKRTVGALCNSSVTFLAVVRLGDFGGPSSVSSNYSWFYIFLSVWCHIIFSLYEKWQKPDTNCVIQGTDIKECFTSCVDNF